MIVVCLLKSIVQDQLTEASLMTATSLASASLQDVENGKYQLIIASTEEILAKPFLSSLKKSSSPLHQNLAPIIVDESHTVETWTGQRFDYFILRFTSGKISHFLDYFSCMPLYDY